MTDLNVTTTETFRQKVVTRTVSMFRCVARQADRASQLPDRVLYFIQKTRSRDGHQASVFVDLVKRVKQSMTISSVGLISCTKEKLYRNCPLLDIHARTSNR
jgi:hypothetical protein